MPETAFRLMTILLLLPRYPRTSTVQELQEKLAECRFKVTARTIQRNLNSLSGMYSLLSEGHKPQRWCWRADAPLLQMPGMKPLTALTFRLARQHLAALLPANLLGQLDPYLGAADCALGERNPAYRWADKVRWIPSGLALLPPADDPQIMAVVNDALWQEYCFSADYCNQHGIERTFERVHPLALVLRGPALYLLATLDDFEDVRQLRVHRFLSAELLPDQPRKLPPDFDLDAYIRAGGFDYPEGEPLLLVALFQRGAARHLRETPLSPDQQICDEDDWRVRLTATVSDTPLLRWWLLGFGAEVEVLEPPALREEMATTARRMTWRYREPPVVAEPDA